MKRAIGLAVIWLAMLAGAAFGQEQEVKAYFKSVPILKILSHPDGYKVLYVKSDMQVGEFYVPHGWFSKSGGKAEIVFGRNPTYPYFTVFYRDGKFDFIRLYVQEDVKDLSWGVLKKTEESNAAFANVQTLNIAF